MAKKLAKPIKLRDLPASYGRWVHPAYRPLVVGQKKRLRFKRSIAASIKRKLLMKRIIPRVPPYFCKACTLSTHSFKSIRHHVCSGRNESRHVISFENEVRIAHLGIKSKAKDCLAVMERLPNPQHVDLGCVVHAAHELPVGPPVQSPHSLSDLCTKVVHSSHQQFVYEEKVREQKADAEYTAWREAELKRFQKITDEDMQGTIYRCDHCYDFFKTYRNYDLHLVSGPCRQKIDAGKALPSYQMVYVEYPVNIPKTRQAVPVEPEKSVRQEHVSAVRCKRCKKTGWESKDDLFHHCLKCTVRKGPYSWQGNYNALMDKLWPTGKCSLSSKDSLPVVDRVILLNVDLALVGRAPREHPVGPHSPLSLSELSTNVVCALFEQKQRLEQEMFCEQGADAGYTWREEELKGVQKITTEDMHGLTYRCGLCLDVLQPYTKFASYLLVGQCRNKIDAGVQPSYELIYIDELPVCLHETRQAGPVEPGKKVRQEDFYSSMPKLEPMDD